MATHRDSDITLWVDRSKALLLVGNDQHFRQRHCQRKLPPVSVTGYGRKI